MNPLHLKFSTLDRIRKGILFLFFLSFSNFCAAATYYLVGTGGNWSDVTQWSTIACGGAAQVAGAGIYYPGQNAAGDIVVICDNKSVTLDVSPVNAIASLTIQATANNTTLTFGAGSSLTVTGAVTQTGPTTTGMTNLLAVGTGTLVCGSVSMPDLTNGGTYISQITLGTTGVITCSGNFASAGAANENLIVVTGNGLIQIGGNFTGNATLTAGTGTVELYSATTATVHDYAFYNLLISGGTKSGTTANIVSNNLDITGGSWNPGTVNFTVNGATTISGTGAYADNNDGGVNTFVGLVTLSGTGTWTSTAEITANGTGLIFQGGIRNNSTASPSFRAGAASFTASQVIDGSGAMSFATTAYINGAFTVTNQNTNTVTITGTLNGTVAGSTWLNDNGSTLTL
jgi:fibronectin-binding autotransporter adhesin